MYTVYVLAHQCLSLTWYMPILYPVFITRTMSSIIQRIRLIPDALLLGIVVIIRLGVRHPFDSISSRTCQNNSLKLATLALPSIVVKHFSNRPL